MFKVPTLGVNAEPAVATFGHLDGPTLTLSHCRLCRLAGTIPAMTSTLCTPVSPGLRWTVLAVLLGLASACSDKPADNHAADSTTPVAVTISTVNSTPLAQPLVRTGTLRARRSVRLHSQEEGRVEALPVFAGDAVKAGALLVRLDDRLLRAELNKAEATRQQAAQDYQRLQRLVSRKLISEDELLRAKTALRVAEAEESLLKARVGYATITAPFDGIISERRVEPGDAVPKFAHLLTLIDPQSLYTEVAVSELVLPTLEIGAAVPVRIDALGSAQLAGRIERIHPTIDAGTRQGVVEIALTSVPAGAHAGQLCRVYLPGELQERRTIPLIALRNDTEGEYVYTVDSNAKARRTRVTSGMSLGDRIEILDGLNEGDQVITRGFINLAAGKPVEIVTAADSPTAPP